MKPITLFLGIIILLFFSCKKENPGPTEVFMENSKFNPSSITISPGTTITRKNKESVIHTVTSNNNGMFNSGDMDKNKTFSFTFPSVGTFGYYCKYHSGMTGTVIVQ